MLPLSESSVPLTVWFRPSIVMFPCSVAEALLVRAAGAWMVSVRFETRIRWTALNEPFVAVDYRMLTMWPSPA